MTTTTDRQPTKPTASIFPFDPMQFPATSSVVPTAEQQAETAPQAPVEADRSKKARAEIPKAVRREVVTD